jgi:hypothetical protein
MLTTGPKVPLLSTKTDARNQRKYAGIYSVHVVATAIHAGKGLLVNLWRYAASFSMMIGDLKQWMIPHQILQYLTQLHERAEQEDTPY